MPIHDWTRVRSNRFHDFHQSWTIAIRNALNAGRLPPGYFAMVEQKASGSRFLARTEAASYAQKANRITVCHAERADVVAVTEIVSPGNRESRDAIRAFARNAAECLDAGVNLLLVDLFSGASNTQPPDKPLTVVSYAAGANTVAYIEPVAVGDPLPDMPIFLTPDRYVNCPLETTYATAWEQFPTPLRWPLES